jgi:transposase
MITANDASIRPAQRVEVFTGTGRRRTWLHEEKVRIVAEIGSSGHSVCAIARRHGLSPQLLFGWRRRLRDAEAASAESGGSSSYPRLLRRIRLRSHRRRRQLPERSRLKTGKFGPAD